MRWLLRVQRTTALQRRLCSIFSLSNDAFNRSLREYVAIKATESDAKACKQNELASTCELIHSVTQATYAVVEDRLLEALERFSPARPPTPAGDPEALATRRLLLHGIAELADAAGYAPLSKEEMHLAMTSHVRVPLPIRIQWEQLDRHLMEDVGHRVYGQSGSYRTQPPPFADKLIVFHRGCGVHSETGLFYNDKAEEVFNRLVRLMKSVTTRRVRAVRHKAAVPTSPPLEPPSPQLPAIGLVKREALSNMTLSAKNLAGRITLQDAAFQSMIILHFPVDPDSLQTKVALSLRHFMEETETALETLQSLTRRSVYVVRTVFQQWRNHRRRLSEESFDLDWDDLESIWADSREVDWSEPSVKSVTAPTGTKSVDSSIIVSNRHRLLNLTDTGHWAREIEADPPDWQERRGSISFHIRELRSVPLSELFLNFPAATVHMKPLDVAKLSSYVIAGLSVLHISSDSASLGSYGSMLAIGAIAALALRVFYRYQIARMYAEHSASQRATEQAYSRGGASLSSLAHDASVLEAREACTVLAAAYLCGSTPVRFVPFSDILRECSNIEKWMALDKEPSPAFPRIQSRRGLDTLVRLGLLVHDESSCTVAMVAAVDAQASLQSCWSALLFEQR